VPGFVDIHSHVVPSGDDGAQSVEHGVALCREAARRGTSVLYATPHVWAHLPLTPQRERATRAAFAEVAAAAPLELRLGYELAPARWLLREDLSRYVLEGTDAVLIEVPFVELAKADVGAEVALRYFDGTALTPSATARRLPSHAASRGA
jgi:tyrosine-protein phosphatase YwqE